MENLPFVIWMVGAPFGVAYNQYVNEYLCKNKYSSVVNWCGATISMALYCFIGFKLFKG